MFNFNHFVNGLVLTTLFALASSLDLSHSISTQKDHSATDEPTTTRQFDEFKNIQQLDQNVLPDISHLADKFRDKAKYGYLVGMLDVWKATLLSDGRFKVSKGKSQFISYLRIL